MSKKDVKDIFVKIIDSQRVVPFASGAIAIRLFSDVIKSDLQGVQFFQALAGCLIIFLTSIIAYVYLSKIEKEKDTAMLDMTKRIIEAVYKHFGVTMANKDAIATAGLMNPLMQSITNLVKEFQKLAEKGYKD